MPQLWLTSASISNIEGIIKLAHSRVDPSGLCDGLSHSPGGAVLQDDIAAVQVTVKRKAALL